jgi:hypothetical protein
MTRQIGFLTAALLGAVTIVFLNSLDGGVRAQSADPCAAVTSSAALTGRGGSAGAASQDDPKKSPLDHDDRWRHLDSLWAHRAAVAYRRVAPQSADSQSSRDVGEIAVVEDTGDLMIKPNPVDLGDVGLRFTANDRGGYNISTSSYAFRQPLGSSIALTDDATQEIALPFAFTFFGVSRDRVFLNSDGNLTFDEGDTASTERSVSRLLTGPPRIAPFFADLNPSSGGKVLTSGDSSAFSITWCAVPEYGGRATATVQVTLLAAGAIEMQVSNRTTLRTAVVGVSPGHTTDFTPVDLTARGTIDGGRAAVGEQFTTLSDLDTVGVSRRFLAEHPDEFDNLVIFTDTKLLTDSFAYEITVANGIRGLNLATFDYSKEYGSTGRLQSVCNMDALSKYPDDPLQKFFGENSTVSVMGQEIGHRWLAFFEFRDHNGRRSQALLGRDQAHWSFFVDSDASVLEGNDIQDLGAGSFRTTAAVQRYNLLDQYAMGLVDKSQVPPFFYVENPTNVTPLRTAVSNPQVGVTFNGVRRDVTIDDVIAIAGERVPSSANSPRVYRQAFVYVVSAGKTADPEEIVKLDRIRVAWDQFLSAATDLRMRAETRLTFSSDR